MQPQSKARFVGRIAGSAWVWLVALVPTARAQCAMCQASLANSEGGGSVISGFRQGIALLLLVMVVIGVFVWRVVRRAKTEFELRNSQDTQAVSTTI